MVQRNVIQRQGGRGHRAEEGTRAENRQTRVERAQRDDQRRGRPEGGRDQRRGDPTSHFDSDWAGRAILERYLSGEGDWDIADQPAWTGYMKDSELLRRQVRGEVITRSVALSQGADGTRAVDWHFHAEVENGEGIVGYQYLHGTNGTVGDFQVTGAATVHRYFGSSLRGGGSTRAGSWVQLHVVYRWNDMIDPNPQYGTDTVKSIIAEVITLGEAESYRISIGWTEDVSVWVPDSGPFELHGYPAPDAASTANPAYVPPADLLGPVPPLGSTPSGAARAVQRCAGVAANPDGSCPCEDEHGLETVGAVVAQPGSRLPGGVQAEMEGRLGAPFGDVRVHDDDVAASSARAVGAVAYTTGSHVVFDRSRIAPDTAAGKHTLAHELVHVLQQRGGNVPGQGAGAGLMRLSHPDDTYEREAEQYATAAMGRATVTPTQGRAVARSVGSATWGSVVQRQVGVGVDEPAGGCGVCMGPQAAGITAHAMIQTDFEIQNPLGLVELPFSAPGDDNGRLDLAVAVPGGMRIGEIKPANENGIRQGILDMAWYLRAVSAAYPGQSIRPLSVSIVPGWVGVFPNAAGPDCPTQNLYVNLPMGGIYTYFCQPTFSQLRRSGLCNCEDQRRRVPVQQPVPVVTPAPAPARRQVADFVRRVLSSGEDAVQAARRFVADHPEVRDYVVAFGVGIILGTIAEDVVTVGAGLLDDPATIAIGLALIRVARGG
jgi:hypothetical protein